jgi:hypothetical protein
MLRARLEALGMIDVTNSGGSTTGYSGEWIYYRIVVTWRGGDGVPRQREGNWAAVQDAYQGGGGVWELIDGAWQWVQGGWLAERSPGSVISTGVPGPGTYHLWGEYWWGPIPGYGWLGALHEYGGTVTCQ